MKNNYIFTSESVTEGHPDKVADQISDAILDYVIQRDKSARVACETLISNGICVISGELKTSIYAPMQEIAREVLREIGYTDASYGFDYRSAGVLNGVGEQSIDIARGIEQEDGTLGAGDQGIVFGYACNETKELMPLPISLAHKLAFKLSEVRKNGTLSYLRPDGKVQVSVEYENNFPKAIKSVVVSTQHCSNVGIEQLREDIVEEVIKTTIPKELIGDDIEYFINTTGRFVIGGPQADTGLTGRKIVVDSYGGSVANGGGAFSGKDPTKIDRSASYMARYIAKNLVASGVCDKISVQIAYVIAKKEPVSLMVDTFNQSKFSDEEIINCIKEIFPLTPSGIIKELNLLEPIYKKTASYGHFGRENVGFSWERVDKIEQIKDYLKF